MARRSPYDNSYNRNSQRIDARPIGSWATQAGMRGVHRDTKGNVIGGYSATGEAIGTKANAWRRPDAKWTGNQPTPAAQPATPAPAPAPAPAATQAPATTPTPQPTASGATTQPTPPAPAPAPAVSKETFAQTAARKAKESAASGAFGTGAQAAAKRATAAPLEKALWAARAKQSAPSVAAAPAAPKQPTAGEKRRAAMDTEAQGMIAQARALQGAVKTASTWVNSATKPTPAPAPKPTANPVASFAVPPKTDVQPVGAPAPTQRPVIGGTAPPASKPLGTASASAGGTVPAKPAPAPQLTQQQQFNAAMNSRVDAVMKPVNKWVDTATASAGKNLQNARTGITSPTAEPRTKEAQARRQKDYATF